MFSKHAAAAAAAVAAAAAAHCRSVPTIALPETVEAAVLSNFDFPLNKQLNESVRLDFQVLCCGSLEPYTSFPKVVAHEAWAAAKQLMLAGAEASGSRRTGLQQHAEAASSSLSSPRAAVVAGASGALPMASAVRLSPDHASRFDDINAFVKPFNSLAVLAAGTGPIAEVACVLNTWLNSGRIEQFRELLEHCGVEASHLDITSCRVSYALAAAMHML
jgi:hypothetical protein